MQIVHGMAEHGGRYLGFAEALTAQGYAVYAQDLPGHGQTVSTASDLGFVDSPNPFRHMLDAVHAVRAQMVAAHSELPVVLFGHSMGSFLSQYSIAEQGQGLAACVLSGTTSDLGPLRRLGLAINRMQLHLFGPHHRSALTEALSFKAFNRKFAPNRSAADWLSRDPEEVDAYCQSALCGFRCTPGIWASLLAAGARFGTLELLQSIPKSLPILLISGDADPVCQGALGPQKLAAQYRGVGLQASAKAYPGARHELLHETNRAEVIEDLLQWLARNVYGKPSR
jgi:alpha-beta hydrolase superfamily lysophospholipase